MTTGGDYWMTADTTRAWLRREGETVQHEAVWEAWRRVRVIRRAA
jgi:hypothetical protein